jgi:hypothetical protein
MRKITKPTLAILVIGLVVSSMVGVAYTVDYLSNEVTASVEVEKPFILEVSEDDNTYTSGDLGNVATIKAGNTEDFYINIENTANNDLDASLKLIIYNSGGIDFSEIDSFKVLSVTNDETGNPPGDGPWQTCPIELVGAGYGSTIGPNKIAYTVPVDDVPAETSYTIHVEITLSPYAHGTFDMSLQLI